MTETCEHGSYPGVCFHCGERMKHEARFAGPGDFFEVASNNSPDPVDDDDEVIEPQDYTGDYPLEGEDGDEGDC